VDHAKCSKVKSLEIIAFLDPHPLTTVAHPRYGFVMRSDRQYHRHVHHGHGPTGRGLLCVLSEG